MPAATLRFLGAAGAVTGSKFVLDLVGVLLPDSRPAEAAKIIDRLVALADSILRPGRFKNVPLVVDVPAA